MIIVSEFPPRTDDQLRFDTYRFYLRSFANHLSESHGDWETFGKMWAAKVSSLSVNTSLDNEWLARFLKLAWNTEHLLTLEIPDVEMARISNQWLPVQAYYAVYSAAEAFAYCIDGHKTEGHAKTA